MHSLTPLHCVCIRLPHTAGTLPTLPRGGATAAAPHGDRVNARAARDTVASRYVELQPDQQ